MASGNEPFVGEIGIAGFNFAPTNWATCNGQLLPLAQNTALFSLLGTFYGGNGTSNFALPNFQGMCPMGTGNGPGLTPRVTGETAGTTLTTLLQSEMPFHTHPFVPALKTGTTPNTANAVSSMPGISPNTDFLYADTASATDFMAPLAVNFDPQTSVSGGGLPHNNMQPYLVLNFIIAMQGVFPPRS